MSNKERKWRRIYLLLMIIVYGVYGPVTLLMYLGGEEGFPITFLIVGIALPFIRKNHLNRLQHEQ